MTKRSCIMSLGVVLLLGIAAGCTRNHEDHLSSFYLKTYTDSGLDIIVSINEQFIVKLNYIAETEAIYQQAEHEWQARYDFTMLALVESGSVKTPEENETYWFKFKALKKGQTEVIMVYVRWLPENMAAGDQEVAQKVFNVYIQ